jgi:hypothetical protein
LARGEIHPWSCFGDIDPWLVESKLRVPKKIVALFIYFSRDLFPLDGACGADRVKAF